MAAEQPLAALGVAGVVSCVGAQTGNDLDDVVAVTDCGNYALIQAKAGLQLGKAEKSPLAKALAQAVTQYLDGTLAVPGRTPRKVDPERDALVICTDLSAPSTVRRDLESAVSRTGSQPPGTQFGHELSAPQLAALNVALDHIRRLWVAVGRPTPTDEEVRSFLRALRVIVVDAADDRPDQRSSVLLLSTVLSPQDAASAWPVLVAEGQAASVTREWRDRPALAVALSRSGVWLMPPARHADDIGRLRQLSALNLQTLQSEALLPVSGGLHIGRDVNATLAAAVGEGNVLIVGAAGSGKSAVAQRYATDLSHSHEVVVLRAADVAGANRVPLSAPLTTVLRAWTGGPGVVVIDGIDALRGADDREVLSQVVSDLRDTRWQVVATARTFDARNSPHLKNAFTGEPLAAEPAQVDTLLRRVRHVLVSDFTDAELASGIPDTHPIASLLTEASEELRVLLRNPFNLRLAAQLTPTRTDQQHQALLTIRSRVGLLEAYWERRVRNEDRTAREAVLSRLCQAMVSNRTLRVVEREPVVVAGDCAALAALLSAGVLSEEASPLPGARRVLSLSHNILFDYATALYVLLDPEQPTRLLQTFDDDPILPLVARPSLELVVELLWEHRSTGQFWPVCLAVAESTHVLGSLAVASRLLHLVGQPDDLAPLHPSPGQIDLVLGIRPEQVVCNQLIGALRAAAVMPDPSRAVDPMATLARKLAENSGSSYRDAALAVDILIALSMRHQAPRSGGGADAWDHALAALLDGCRTNPERMEQIAGAATRQLKHTIELGLATRAAVRRLLDDDAALTQWGGTVLSHLAEAAVAVVRQDRDLARRLASAVLEFRENRDESVSFGGGALMPLTESRRQQAGHGRYALGLSFGELCNADVGVAAEVFCGLIEEGSGAGQSTEWPITAHGSSGWLGYGRHLDRIGDDDGEAAAATLADALAVLPPVAAEPVVAMLAERLHNPSAWDALLALAGHSVELGRRLLPVLESGSLLVHPNTHSSAAALLNSLARHDSTLQHTLESTVIRAHDAADAHGVSEGVTDTLIGCLDRQTVRSRRLLDRLEALAPDSPPPIPPRLPSRDRWHVRSPDDDLSGLSSEQQVIENLARALNAEIAQATSGNDSRPDSERRLPDMLVEAQVAVSSIDPLPDRLALLLVRAAAALARDPRVLPGTDIGTRVLSALQAAADDRQCGTFLGSDGWSPGRRDTAIDGLSVLLRRPEWRDSEFGTSIVDPVRQAMNDANPLVRMEAAYAAWALHAGDEPRDRATNLSQLVLAETDPRVRLALLKQLARDAANAPDVIDRLLSQLLSHDRLAEHLRLSRDHRESVIDLLRYLALVHDMPFSSTTIEQWSRQAPEHADDLDLLFHHARPHLHNPGAARRRTFHLLEVAATSAYQRWTLDPAAHLPGANLDNEQIKALKGAAQVVHAVAQQIYFASGAADSRLSREPQPAHDPAEFSALAHPALTTCARLDVPRVTHPVVETLVFLAPQNERRALRAVADAVSARSTYAGELLAGAVVIDYLERLLAEQRPLVLTDTDGVDAFRHLLGTLAAVGNESALTLAYTFAEVFR